MKLYTAKIPANTTAQGPSLEPADVETDRLDVKPSQLIVSEAASEAVSAIYSTHDAVPLQGKCTQKQNSPRLMYVDSMGLPASPFLGAAFSQIESHDFTLKSPSLGNPVSAQGIARNRAAL